jgi:hypothetical protein
MTVPFTFANASGRVPAAQLDADFAYVANNVSTANIVVFAAQPNITSVGNLTSLRVDGSVTSTQYIGNGNALTNIPGANVVGAVTYATTANAVAGANVVGAVTYATTANAVAGANVVGAVTLANIANTALAVAGANVSGQVGNALVAGTVYTNAQPNITSVGTLSSLSVTGNVRARDFYGISINSNTGNLLVSANTGTPELNWTFINDYSAPGVASLLGATAGFNQRSEVLLPGRFSTGVLTFTGPDYASFPDSLVIAAGENISIAQTPGGLGNTATYVTTFDTDGNWTMPANVSVTGNVAGNYFIGNGSQLTGIAGSYDDADVTALLSNLGSNTISGTGNITTTANISGNYILGNGSQLTGLTATYGNANVATFLGDYGSNTISTTGNVTLGNVSTGGVVSAVGNVRGSNFNTVGLVTATGNVTGGNVLTGGYVSAVGNVTGNYFIGNGSQLTGISSSIQSSIANGTSTINIATANGNATITANAVTYTFGTDDTLTLPGGSRLRPLGANLDIFAGTGSYVNLITADESSYMGVGGAGGYIVTAGGTWDFNTTGNLTAPGNISAVGNITAANFFGNGNTLSNVAAQVASSWTLSTGTNTANITVPLNGTYSMWVRGNIPNGIVVWNATVTVTNTNVPVIGQQFAWNYEAGNALILTSIPAQIIGTAGAISNASPSLGTTTNVFEFTIDNNSGNSAVVNYGYTKIG